jgi:hypothetical protein
MKFSKLLTKVQDGNCFPELDSYIKFCGEYLDYAHDNLQAVIVFQNENNYCFYQYGKGEKFRITRPINSTLMCSAESFSEAAGEFVHILKHARTLGADDTAARQILNNVTYTIQQSIGATLDGLPVGKSNTARKLNGALFEKLVRLIIQAMGINCRSGVVKLPIVVDGKPEFHMSYQHDLIVEKEGKIGMIGSVKTSSKDRLDKIFIDKFLHNKLTETTTPHVAVFLNDVQRRSTKTENKYKISTTFLSGHFKGYTVRLNPLDGVYYCDILPVMRKDAFLKRHIKSFDRHLTDDIWKFYRAI